MINTDPHNKKEKGLIPVPTPQGENMWIHPDLIESLQWTIITNRKFKSKGKASTCKVICVSSREAEADVASITDSEEEEIILTTKQGALPMVGTQSDQ